MKPGFRLRSFFAGLVLLAAFSFSSFASPASSTAKPFSGYPAGLSGDYVVYRDYSWGKSTWIGILYYDDSTWGVFVLTPDSGSRVSILFTAENSGGKLILTGQNIISKISKDDVLSVNYLMRILPDFYEWRNGTGEKTPANSAHVVDRKGRTALLPALAEKNLDLPAFGGAVTLTFAPEVPVFNLQSLRGSDGKPVLELVRAGRVQSGGDSVFFGFTPAGTTMPGTALSVPATRKNEARTVDGITLNLDDQWTMVADNTFFLGNAAVVLVDTLDLSLMQIPQSNVALSLVRLFSLSSAGSWAVPSELSVSGTSSRFVISNLFFDSERGTLNRDIKVCVLSSDGKKCAVVSLSVSDTAYKANPAYFDSIVNTKK